MGTFVPVAIIFVLGATAGLVCHLKWPSRFWKAYNVAALIGSIAWIAGCYVIFALTAPSELVGPSGTPMLGPLFGIVLICWVAAAFIGWAVQSPAHSGN